MLFPGAASGTRGASREGKKFRLGSFDPALVLKTDRLHFLQWIMAPWALPHCKYAVNLTVARGIVNMQSFGLAVISVALSGDLEAPKQFFKKASQLKTFFLGAFCPHSRWPRHPVKMQGYELATLFVAPSDFQSFCERDPRKARRCFWRTDRGGHGTL